MPGNVKRYRRTRRYKKFPYKGYITGSQSVGTSSRNLAFPRPRMSINPFPDKLFCKLRYTDTIRITAGGAGLLGWHTFRGNGITDPDISGTGHQVYLNDTLAALYRKSCVYGSKCVATFVNVNSSSGDPYKCFLRPRVSTTSPSIPSLEEERSRCKYGILTGAANNKVVLRSYCATGEMYGVKKTNVLIDDLFACATSTSSTTNPVNAWNWLLSVYSMNSSGAADVFVNVNITYYVRFNDRIPQGQS